MSGAPSASGRLSRFQRFLLPGLAFKAVVIGGGYATGRELAEFFLPNGPWGGLAGMLLATMIWSAVCAATFVFARSCQAYDYRSFFQSLLGRGWILFDIAYLMFVVLVLSVFGAAAGSIGAATFGLPSLAGTVALMVMIVAFAAFGDASVERLFKYVSFLLYGVYALFLGLALWRFGDRIAASFTSAEVGSQWAMGGVTYAGYNIIGAVVILPVVRHMTGRRDALVAGLIAGPLAMLPAILFFVCMAAFYPGIADEVLPSDFILRQLDAPVFHLLFQSMIFAALLESGTGAAHAINERINSAWLARRGADLPIYGRGIVTATLLVGCIFVADRIGLVALIGGGYRILAYVILGIYVVPLFLTLAWKSLRRAMAA